LFLSNPFLRNANEDTCSQDSQIVQLRTLRSSMPYTSHLWRAACNDAIEGRKHIIASRDARNASTIAQTRCNNLDIDSSPIRTRCDLLPGKCKRFTCARAVIVNRLAFKSGRLSQSVDESTIRRWFSHNKTSVVLSDIIQHNCALLSRWCLKNQCANNTLLTSWNGETCFLTQNFHYLFIDLECLENPEVHYSWRDYWDSKLTYVYLKITSRFKTFTFWHFINIHRIFSITSILI